MPLRMARSQPQTLRRAGGGGCVKTAKPLSRPAPAPPFSGSPTGFGSPRSLRRRKPTSGRSAPRTGSNFAERPITNRPPAPHCFNATAEDTETERSPLPPVRREGPAEIFRTYASDAPATRFMNLPRQQLRRVRQPRKCEFLKDRIESPGLSRSRQRPESDGLQP